MSFFDFVLGNLTNPGTNPSNIFRLSALFQDYLGVKAEQNFFDFRLWKPTDSGNKDYEHFFPDHGN